MDLAGECALSFYQELACLSQPHNVWLVQHRENHRVFVKKRAAQGSLGVFQYLKDHPVRNTPRIYEVVEDGEELILIEEYISGDTLEAVLERGPLSEQQAAALGLQLCETVARLHGAQPPILHRDIKPSNLILTPDGVLKLIDLGSAKQERREEHTHTSDTTLLGTVGYAAPEQYGFEASSVQTDIYSIGVLLNVMLTGRFPMETLAQGRLTPIIKKCTEMAPVNRYPTVSALEAALSAIDAALRGECPKWRPIAGQGWRRFLPPGFRGKALLVKIGAAMGYLLLFSLALTLEVENTTGLELWLNRLVFLEIFLGMILFTGNYMGIQEQLPLSRSGKWPVRLLGILLYDVLIFCGSLFLMTNIVYFLLA